MTPRVCLVGYGSIARVHARVLNAAGATIHTVVGRVAEPTKEFATAVGARHHTIDLAAALADDRLDAVVIASSSPLHAEQAALSLSAGKHVLVEIPLALRYRDATDLVELARRRDLCLMVCHSQRFIPSLRAIREQVADGALHVRHLVGRHGTLRRENVGWTGRQRSWTDSLLWHHAGHLVDFSLWLAGADHADVLAHIAKPDPRTGVPQDLDVLLRMPSDMLVALSLSYNSHFVLDEYLIIGEEKSVHFDRGRLVDPSRVCDEPSARGTRYEDLAWEAQDAEFLDAIRAGREPQASGAAVLPTYRLLQEIEDRFDRALTNSKVDPAGSA